MSNVIHVNERNFDNAVANKLCIVDFSAEWCGPCQMFAPILEEIADEANGRYAALQVDVSAEPGLAARFGVMNIPTLLIMRNGEIVRKFVGLQDKAAVVKALEQA